MTNHVMMKCGCAANADCSGADGVKFDPPIPSCVIHNCIEVADAAPNLEGRTARCAMKSCKSNLTKHRDTHYGALRDDGRSYAPSSLDLPFFEHRPAEEFDKYFCGCMGWD